MAQKYNKQSKVKIHLNELVSIVLDDKHNTICVCFGSNADANAEKIKNLLNETANSQGKYPKY